jgi:hypothetical protein
VWTDHRQKVGEPRRRLADLRSLGLDVGQGANEHGERLTTEERRCRGQYGVEAGIVGGRGDGLGGGVILGEEISFVDTQMGSSPVVCEVEYLERDRHSTHAATHLERVDPLIGEVAEELRPRTLLLVRRVPDRRFAGSVVAARSSCRVGAGPELVTCGALVPVGAGQLSPRCGGDRIGELHT